MGLYTKRKFDMTNRVPNEALVDDMVAKAKEFSELNAKTGAKTSYSITREQLKAINNSNREWYQKRFEDEIPSIKKEATDMVYRLVMCMPIMVLHDHGEEIMREDAEINKESKFFFYLKELHDCFDKGLVTIDDLRECLYEETGVNI